MGQEYNKAVRDKIPQIIQARGEKCEVKRLSDSEFLVELEKKLGEEVAEYQQSKTAEELADIIEVIRRISELKGIGIDNLENIRSRKAEQRGRFSNNLFLVRTK